ncbi:unnamed protein product [Caenorhabditis brenneri]
MTSWCFRQEPNYFLGFIFNAQAYFNYSVMIYPVLFSGIRLVIAYQPNRHEEVNSKLLRIFVPIAQFFPFPLLIFTIPALGVCRQHYSPYPFGSVYVHFINSWKGIMNAPIIVGNSAVWLSTCLILNWILYRKLRKLKSMTNISQPHQTRNKILEISLSLTTIAMLFAYTTNLVFLGAFMIDYDVATYLVVFRPFGFDLELCVVPWVFYLTHPAFKKKSETRVVVNSIRKQVLLSVVRLMLILYPQTHREVNSKILQYSIPVIHIYPLLFSFFMFPALGVCRQLLNPYPFGSIFIHFIDSWDGIINMPFEICNTFFWLMIYLLCNYGLFRKLRNLKLNSQCHLHMNQSARYRKAEFSLSLTTGLMVLAYVLNIIFQCSFLIDYGIGTYMSFLRPYGNDLEACVVPWAFYLTHPAFQKKNGSNNSTSTQQKTTLT